MENVTETTTNSDAKQLAAAWQLPPQEATVEANNWQSAYLIAR